MAKPASKTKKTIQARLGSLTKAGTKGKKDCYSWLLLLLDKLYSSMVWLTGSGIFNPVLCVQMQVQELPVATAATLVCRYVVKYHGECIDFVHIAQG